MVKSVHVIDGNQADVVAPVLEREMSALREQHGPMIRATFPFGGDGWLAIGYKAARDLMQHPDFSTGGHGPALPRMRENGGARPPWPRTLSMMDPPEHTAKRRLLSKHLSVKRVMALEPRVAVEVDGLLDEVIAHGQGVDIVRHFTDVLPLVGLCGLLGTDLAEREQFVPQAKALIAGKVTDPDEGDRLVASIVEYFADLVLRRRQEPRDDLLSALIYDSEAGVLTDEDLHSMGFSLLSAGHDATASILGGIVYVLSHAPDLFQRLKNHGERLRPAIEEFLRYLPAGTGSRTRIATRDVELGGVTIKKGEAAVPWIHAANFDPAAFASPQRFDVTRTGEPHIRFGFGAHACVGQQLARMELTTAVRGVLSRFDTLVAVDRAADWREQILLRGPKSLQVTWQR